MQIIWALERTLHIMGMSWVQFRGGALSDPAPAYLGGDVPDPAPTWAESNQAKCPETWVCFSVPSLLLCRLRLLLKQSDFQTAGSDAAPG